MQRTHLSDAKDLIFGDRSYNQLLFEMKPNGLWFSYGNEWIEWCNTYCPQMIRGNYLYNLEIDDTDILKIKSFEDLKDLHDNYGYSMLKAMAERTNDTEAMFPENVLSKKTMVDWQKLTKDYKGIEFIDYHAIKVESVFDIIAYAWFNSVDVSGGCIWDLSALKSYNKVELTKKTPE